MMSSLSGCLKCVQQCNNRSRSDMFFFASSKAAANVVRFIHIRSIFIRSVLRDYSDVSRRGAQCPQRAQGCARPQASARVRHCAVTSDDS